MDNIRKKFSQIYNQSVEKIYRFIFLKVNSKEIAEDLTSNTFLKGWERFKNNHHNIENPNAFLYKIAKNLVIDHYREKGKVQLVSTEAYPLVDPRTDVEEEVFLNSDLERVKKIMFQMKDDYQNVIIWHYLDDLPIPEVAKLLDRSEEATRMLLSRALKELRNQLEE